MNIQDRIRADPMNADLKWTDWYGFGVLSGMMQRLVCTIETNENQKSLVRDCHTGRLFVHDNLQGGLVQYWPDHADSVEWFKARPK